MESTVPPAGVEDHKEEDNEEDDPASDGEFEIPAASKKRQPAPKRGSGCRTAPGGRKLAPPRLQRGLQWVEVALEKSDTLVDAFSAAKDRSGLPKEKLVREAAGTLTQKEEQLGKVTLGFKEEPV